MRRSDGRTVIHDWIIGGVIAFGVWVASWALLFVLARRLPAGTARDLAAFIPDCITTIRRLRADPRVPVLVKNAATRIDLRSFPVHDLDSCACR
jgi:hypothetical protein